MDENIIEIIKSFKETKNAIDEFVPLLTNYATYSEDVKKAIETIKSTNIDESNKELKISINKLESVQKEIEKSILSVKEYTAKHSKQVEDFERKIDVKIKQIESKNEKTINEFEEKIKLFESSMYLNNKKTEEKLNQIISLINNSNNKDSIVLKNIESSIKNIEDVFE